MNREAFLIAEEFIRTRHNANHKFNMSYFFDAVEPGVYYADKNLCDTTACLAGDVVLSHGYGISDHGTIYTPDGEPMSTSIAWLASDILGLKHHQWLFHAGDWPYFYQDEFASDHDAALALLQDLREGNMVLYDNEDPSCFPH